MRVISEIQRFIDESIGNAFDFVQFSLKSKYTKRSNDTLRKCDDKDYIFKNEIIASLSMRKNADRNSTRWTQMIASALYGCYAFYGNHRYTVDLDGEIFGVLFTICTCTCRFLFSIVNFKISLVQMFRMLVFERIVAQFGARASACIWKYNDELM